MANDLIKQEKNDLVLTLEKKGMTKDVIADRLLELLHHKEIKCDKNGNAYEVDDGTLALKVVELWLKLQGMGKAPSQHLHIGKGVDLDGLLKSKKKKNK